MLDVQWDGDVAHVILSRPETRNAQDPQMWADLHALGLEIGEQARVIIVRSLGPSFSAGLDRRILIGDPTGTSPSLLHLATSGADALRDFITSAQRAFTWLRSCRAITIAAVQGHAIGAGFQLALSCDLMVVAPDAQMAMRETSLGLVPDLGGIGPLVERVGPSRALHICATGRWIDATEALATGIASTAAGDLTVANAAAALASELCAAPSGALRELKPLVMGAPGRTTTDQLAAEREAQIRRILELTGQPTETKS